MDHRRAHLLLGLVIVFWAGNYPLGKLALQSSGPSRSPAGANVVGGLVLVPLSLLVERPWEHWQTWIGWLVVLYGAVPIALGHLWFYQVIRTLGASRTVTFLNLMPFAVLDLSWALVGETIHAYHVGGAALVVTGVYLATRPT